MALFKTRPSISFVNNNTFIYISLFKSEFQSASHVHKMASVCCRDMIYSGQDTTLACNKLCSKQHQKTELSKCRCGVTDSYCTDVVTGTLSYFKVPVAMTQCLASEDMEVEAT